MSNFLIICGSNSNTANSQNYIAANLLKTLLEGKLDKCSKKCIVNAIFCDSLTDIPFISHHLLKTHFFPAELNSSYELISKNVNLIFVVPEHNSNFHSFFKNIFDWWTVKNTELLKNKKVILVSASKTTKTRRGIETTGKLTFESVGCTDFHFINWNNEKATEKFQEIIESIAQ